MNEEDLITLRHLVKKAVDKQRYALAYELKQLRDNLEQDLNKQWLNNILQQALKENE